MMKYNDTAFNTDRIETLLNDLDEEDIIALVRIVASQDRLSIEDGKPLFTEEQISVIGKFVDFADDPASLQDEVEEEYVDDDIDLADSGDVNVEPSLENPAPPAS